ncbi:unnamed protein product, partial [Rotaria sordida]
MSTYNNVLGNFISYSDDLSDLDDDDDDDDDDDNDNYEDSVAESEFEINNRYKLSQANIIDERSLIIESLLSEKRGSMSLASSEASLLTVPGSTRTRRMSTTKVIDQRPKHLMLGDFELANVVDCEEYVLCCKYSPIGDVFAVGLGNGTIK